MTTKIKKPYRVTQYQQMTELGLALTGTPARKNRTFETGHKDYRFRWTARIVAAFHRGESVLGVRLFTTRITDLREEA